MAWIESHTVLIRHRKLRGLALALRIRPAYAMGHLHALWHAALEQQEDGDLSTWSDEFVALSADYPGDAPQFVRLLHEHGWLNNRRIHDWLVYAGRYLDSKYHTSNPTKIKQIKSAHSKSALRPPKGGPHNITLPTLPNLTLTTFLPPTILEVAQYCELRNRGVDPEKFHAYYTSNGWKVGRNSMKNWKAAVVTWEKNQREGVNGR